MNTEFPWERSNEYIGRLNCRLNKGRVCRKKPLHEEITYMYILQVFKKKCWTMSINFQL